MNPYLYSNMSNNYNEEEEDGIIIPNKKRFLSYKEEQEEYFPNEILTNIYENLTDNYFTKEQIQCGTKNLILDKRTNDIIKRLYRDFPSILQYQQSHIYFMKNNDTLPPYLITCKDVCSNTSNCNQNKISTLSFPNYNVDFTFDMYLKYIENLQITLKSSIEYNYNLNKIQLESNLINNLYKIIWNCECLLIQLPFYTKNTKIGNYYEQKLLQKRNGNWTLLDLIEKVSIFYNQNITINEANNVSFLLINDFNENKSRGINTFLGYNNQQIEEENLLDVENIIQLPRNILIKYNIPNFNSLKLMKYKKKNENEIVFMFLLDNINLNIQSKLRTTPSRKSIRR